MRNEHATLNRFLTSRMFLSSYNRINTALWRLCSSSKAVTPLEPRIQQRIRQTAGLHVGMVVATVRLWIKSSQPFTSLFGEKNDQDKTDAHGRTNRRVCVDSCNDGCWCQPRGPSNDTNNNYSICSRFQPTSSSSSSPSEARETSSKCPVAKQNELVIYCSGQWPDCKRKSLVCVAASLRSDRATVPFN